MAHKYSYLEATQYIGVIREYMTPRKYPTKVITKVNILLWNIQRVETK